MAENGKDRIYIGALAKGIGLLSHVAGSKEPLGLTQLSKSLGHSIGAVQRITFTLHQLGYLRKTSAGQGYILGPKSWALGLAISNQIHLRNVAHPYLEDLSKKVGEIVSLGIIEGTEMIYLDRIQTNHILNVNLDLGRRLPAYSTSLGKVVLAFMTEPKQLAFIREMRMVPLTQNTITDKKRFLAELRRIRKRGFSINNGETDIGVRSVAAPVRDDLGQVIAGVNISVPSIRVTLQDLQKRLSKDVIALGHTLSEILGYKRENGERQGRRSTY